jgi:hypothetical protein
MYAEGVQFGTSTEIEPEEDCGFETNLHAAGKLITNSQYDNVLKELILQQNPPSLVYQMPLDQHFHKCDQLLAQLELFMRKNFNITSSAEEAPNDWISHTSVIEIKKRIQEVEEKKFEEGLTTAGMNNIIERIDQFKTLDSNAMRSMIEEMEVETDNMSLQFEVIHKEACMLVEQSTEQEVLKVFHEHFKGKNKRAL